MFSVKIRCSFILLCVASVLFLDYTMIFHALISMALHEAGHVISAMLMGCNLSSVELCAQGFTIDLDRSASGYKNIVILTSGPLINLLCSLFFIILFQNSDSYFLSFNLSFGLFNLIPLRFLDGGRLLEEILDICLPTDLASRICSFTNTVLLLITWCFSIYCFLFENTHSSSMFICIFTLINLCLDK